MTIFEFIVFFIGYIIGELLFAYGIFAFTKKLFKKRTISYKLSGIGTVVIYFMLMFSAKDISEGTDLSPLMIIIIMIMCMAIAVVVTFAFVIGEKRALSSGKHTGDFERDRVARKFKPFSILKTLKKWRYPLIKNFHELKDIDTNSIPDFFGELKQEVKEQKAALYILHIMGICFWYILVIGIWLWYFMCYGVYWIVVAFIDTFKELYTHEGNKFSFKEATSEIINSEEVNSGLSVMRNSVKSVTSKAESAISEFGEKANSIKTRHQKQNIANKERITSTDVNEPIIQISDDKDNDNVADELNKKNNDKLKETSGDFNEQTKNNDSATEKNLTKNVFSADSEYPKPVTFSDENINSVDKKNPIMQNIVKSDNHTKHQYKKRKINNINNYENKSPIYYNNSHIQSGNYDKIKHSQNTHFRTPNYKHKTNPVLIFIIIILVLIIGILCGMFFIIVSNKQSDKPSENVYIPIIKGTTDSKKTESIAEVTDENFAEKATENLIQTESSVNISCSKNDVNQIYADIVKSMDFPPPNRGFILDLNNDGINEMIIPDTYDMHLVMYYFDGNSIQSYNFGSFMMLDNFVIYQVEGKENKNYIYYRDECFYKSLQGYYSFPPYDRLNIFIDYPENNEKYSADWTINYNETESYAKGNEPVDTFYEQPSDCHDKLLSAFKKYGFEITENSKYTEIKGLYYDELINKLSGNNNVQKEEHLTTKSKAPKATASITIEPQSVNGNGTELLATVSGNYSYFTYECYWDGEDKTNQLLTSGTSYNQSIPISGGSTISKITFIVTPYNEDDLPGDTITSDYTGPWSYVPVNSYNYGQINAPEGGPINGYATSYILNGGEVAYTRTDLMDGWHVTAVNQCVFNGVIWYELYDSDDGDYYGWVDENHINFY